MSAALIHGGKYLVVLAGVTDRLEMAEEEVDDTIGSRELASHPQESRVAFVHGGGGGADQESNLVSGQGREMAGEEELNGPAQ